MGSISGLLKLTRFPLVFTAMTDSAAGYFLTLRTGEMRVLPLATAAGISACLYAAGMVYNDVADRARDLVIHPERPLPSKRVTPGAAHRFASTLLLLAVGASALFGGWATVWTMATVMVILGYDFQLKRGRLAGSVAMALVRTMNVGIGAFAALHLQPGAMDIPSFIHFPWAAMGVLGAYVFFLTMLSTFEDTDRPAPMALPLGGLMLLTALAGMLLGSWPWNLAAIAAPVFLFPWISRMSKLPVRDRIMQVIRWGVLTIILIDAGFVAGTGIRHTEAAAMAATMIPALLLLPFFRKL